VLSITEEQRMYLETFLRMALKERQLAYALHEATAACGPAKS